MADTTLGTAYIQIVPSAQGIKGSIEDAIGSEGQSAGTSVGSKIGKFAKKAIAGAAIGATITKGVKASFSEGAKLQQSYLGGLDTLYGDAADEARKYAREASKVGVSMNDYSEQAVSFGAALKKAYGGDAKKAVKAANTAIMDMTDNAAKMGTPLESIQQAYQGFAKGQYQLLDNLKLGYGGTKGEMERLLADAEKITGVKYDIDNLGDVYDAIHVIQGELGLTGVAADEAKTTISGSFGNMKAAAKNFAGSLALGQGVKPALIKFGKAFDTFFSGNLVPMLKTLISGLPDIISVLVSKGIPALLSKISTAIANLATSLKAKADSLTADKVKAWAATTIPKLLSSAGELIGKFASGLIENIPKIIVSLGKIAKEIIVGLGSALWPKVKEAAAGIKDRVVEQFGLLKDKVKEKVEALKTSVKEKFDALKDSIKAKVDSLKESIKTKFDSIKESVKTKIDSMKESVKAKVDAMKESVKAKIDAMKESVKAKIDALKESIKTKWDSIKESVKAKVDSMKESVKSKFDSLKESVKGKIDSLKESVKAKFDAIKEKIVSPIETAKEKIKSAIDKIKSIINGAKLSLPHFKLPHFKIDGGELPWGIGGKGKKPSISVEWYKKGGIFNSPSLIGVGEAGPEAVLPLDKLWKHLDNANSGDVTINVYATDGMDVNQLASEIERRLTQMQKRRANAWA